MVSKVDPVAGAAPVTDISGQHAEIQSGEHDPVIALLEGWLADESGYDEETWPELKVALNRERGLIGVRKLFRERRFVQ